MATLCSVLALRCDFEKAGSNVSHWSSARRFREALSRAILSNQSPGDCRAHHPRSVARSSVTVGRPAIGPATPTSLQTLGSIAASQGLQTGRAPDASSYCDQQAPVAVVASADCWVAQTRLAGQQGLPRVTRDHLPQSFYSGTGALKKELLEHFRRTRAMRRSCHHTQKTDDHSRIRDAVSISERPATVEDRAVPGHWEGISSAVAAAARLRRLSSVRHAM